jgi:hypothetical protein
VLTPIILNENVGCAEKHCFFFARKGESLSHDEITIGYNKIVLTANVVRGVAGDTHNGRLDETRTIELHCDALSISTCNKIKIRN